MQDKRRHTAHTSPSPTPLFGVLTRSTPGLMRLRAEREQGRVVDFSWQFASAAAARLLACDLQSLLGRRLSDVVGGPDGHPTLVGRYSCVMEYGNTQSFEQIHVVNGLEDVIVHRVACVADGVEVTLVNLSAGMRLRNSLIEMRPLRSAAKGSQQ